MPFCFGLSVSASGPNDNAAVIPSACSSAITRWISLRVFAAAIRFFAGAYGVAPAASMAALSMHAP